MNFIYKTFILSLLATSLFTKNSVAQSFVWAKNIAAMNGNTYMVTRSIAVDGNGNTYATGEINGTADFDPGPNVLTLGSSTNGQSVFIQKLDANGNLVWVKLISGSVASVTAPILRLDNNNDVYVTGGFDATVDFDPSAAINNITPQGGQDAYLIKLNSAGNLQWVKTWGENNSFIEGLALAVDNGNNIVMGGYFVGNMDFDPGPNINAITTAGTQDGFVLRLASTGNYLWANSFVTSDFASVVSIDVDASNTIYCAGTYTGSIDLDPGTGNNSYSTVTNSQDIFVVQLSTIGNAVWGKEFGGSGNAYLNTIKVDNTNAVYLGGTFSDNIDFDPGASTYSLTSLSTSYDCFISKLNASGGFLWTKQIGGANDDEYGGLDLDPANNIYSTGYFEGSCDFDPGVGNATLNSAGLYDIFMSKLDNNGNYISSHNIGSSDNDGGLAIAIKNNNIYATGVFGATVDFDPSAASNTLTALQSPNTSDLYYFKWSQCAMSYTTINATACSYTLNGQTYTSNGTYTQLFTNAVGCDSIVTLQLTGSGTPTTITATVCNNPYVLNGISYANTGTYTQVYTNVNGCDSSITLQLTAGNTTFGNTTISACDYYIANTQIIFNSGIYTDTLTNSLGCDSILTMNVTIHNSSNSSIVVNACGTYFYNGVGYNTSGVYTNYYLTTFSCDSIVDLDLTITPLPPTNITFSGCGPYISNGQAYTTSGAYTQNFITAQNCDSTIILTLNITTPDTNVTQAGSTLTSQALPPSTYQWIQCNPNPIAIIPNATSASFTPTNNGDYAVIVTLNGCSDTSDCRSMYVNTIEDNYLSTETHLYPNPTDDILHLSFQHAIPTLQVQITSISGQVLYEKNIRDANHILLPIQKLAKGIYFVQLYDGVRKTALKFTKE